MQNVKLQYLISNLESATPSMHINLLGQCFKSNKDVAHLTAHKRTSFCSWLAPHNSSSNHEAASCKQTRIKCKKIIVQSSWKGKGVIVQSSWKSKGEQVKMKILSCSILLENYSEEDSPGPSIQ
jgi:hypothetical protein